MSAFVNKMCTTQARQNSSVEGPVVIAEELLQLMAVGRGRVSFLQQTLRGSPHTLQ